MNAAHVNTTETREKRALPAKQPRIRDFAVMGNDLGLWKYPPRQY